MSQASETVPLTRTHLWVICDEKSQLFQVWEVEDKVPPSTAPELGAEQNNDLLGPGSSATPPREQCPLPFHVEQVSELEEPSNGSLEKVQP